MCVKNIYVLSDVLRHNASLLPSAKFVSVIYIYIYT